MAGQQLDSSFDWQKIARERSIWLVRPLLIIIIATWVLMPWAGKPATLDRNTLIGFLGGALIGGLVTKEAWTYFLITRRKDTKHRKNRMPDEYYFGKVLDVLHWDGESKK